MWHKDTSWSKFIYGTKQNILIPEHSKVILYAKCYPTKGKVIPITGLCGLEGG